MSVEMDTKAANAWLKESGALGRPLREGAESKATVIEQRQLNNLERTRKHTLKEVAQHTRFQESQIQGVWDYYQKFGDTKPIDKIREAVAESAMPQLLRYGVQNFLFDGYAAVPVVYPDLVRVVNSGSAEELYAPLYGAELPGPIQPGQEYGDSRLEGLDVHVKNTKFGRMLSYENELGDDDQTGQIEPKAASMGERMRYVEENQVTQAIKTGGAQGYTTAIGNVNSGGGQISAALIQTADIALEQIVDPLGNLMLVAPDTIFCGPVDKFTGAVILNSALQPSVPGAAGQNTAGSSGSLIGGTTGWTMSVNPLQGLYNLKVSRFLNLSSTFQSTNGLDGTHGAWFLLESKKSIVFQDRTALRVMQEASNAGASFERDVTRFRVDRRFAAAVIESRYIYRGN